MNLELAKEKFAEIVKSQLERAEMIKNQGDFTDFSALDEIVIGVAGGDGFCRVYRRLSVARGLEKAGLNGISPRHSCGEHGGRRQQSCRQFQRAGGAGFAFFLSYVHKNHPMFSRIFLYLRVDIYIYIRLLCRQ